MAFDDSGKWRESAVLETDVFLVSFPKSGNTWMRFMLANAMVQHSQLDISVNFKSIHQLVPDVHVDIYVVGDWGHHRRSDSHSRVADLAARAAIRPTTVTLCWLG